MPHSGTWPEHRNWGVPPAAGLYARHVKGLSLDRVRFTLAQPDFRSTVFLCQSSDIIIAGLTSRAPTNTAAAQVTLFDCQEALITGCQDSRGGSCFLALEGANTRGVVLSGNRLAGFLNQVKRSLETPQGVGQ